MVSQPRSFQFPSLVSFPVHQDVPEMHFAGKDAPSPQTKRSASVLQLFVFFFLIKLNQWQLKVEKFSPPCCSWRHILRERRFSCPDSGGRERLTPAVARKPGSPARHRAGSSSPAFPGAGHWATQDSRARGCGMLTRPLPASGERNAKALQSRVSALSREEHCSVPGGVCGCKHGIDSSFSVWKLSTETGTRASLRSSSYVCSWRFPQKGGL